MIKFYPAMAMRVKDGHKVDLNADLYHLRATMYHPLLEKDVSLPTHFWVFYRVGRTDDFWMSTKSNDQGICLIKGDPRALDPDAEYALAFFPHPDDVRASYAADRAMWLSFTTGGVEWAHPAPSLGAALERRNRVRLSQWTTVLKAKAGGGFAVAPPNAPKFPERGTLKGSEVQPFGWPDVPWRIVLDEGWIRARVAHVFINRRTTQPEAVPPGLMVQAWNEEGKVLGAGTALPKKTATGPAEGNYLVIERPKEKWPEVNLAFRAPPNAWIDVRAGAETAADRLSSEKPIPAVTPPIPPYDPKVSTTVPELWYSDGMEVMVSPTPHGTAAPRKDWSEARKALKDTTEPALIFHLDDVVLVDKEGSPATIAANTRTALFDQLLAIRDPDAAEPIHSTLRLRGPMLRAEEVFPTDPPQNGAKHVFDRLTRLVYVQGTFYDVRERRVTGTPGKQKQIGLRAAMADDHPIGDFTRSNPVAKFGAYEMHYVDVPGVEDPRGVGPMHHLLLFVGMIVHPEPDANVTNLPKLGGLLNDAAERWSPNHPAFKVSSKDYVLAPRGAGATHTIRIRSYFGVDAQQHRSIEFYFRHDSTPKQDLPASQPQGGYIGPIEYRAPKIIYYDSSLASDLSWSAGSTSSDIDGASATSSTLAHEFGHALGLPDEYYAPFDPNKGIASGTGTLSEPRIPTLDQATYLGTKARPFMSDARSMMRGIRLARLRDFWHHAKLLSVRSEFSDAPGRPFTITHRNFAGSILHCNTLGPDTRMPHEPLGEAAVPSTRAIATLFSVAEDEGTVSAMFAPPGGTPVVMPAAQRFDGLIVIRVFCRFEFESAIANATRWTIMRSFTDALYDANYRPKVRFQVVPGPGKVATLSRIAILVHPHVQHGPGSNVGHTFEISAASIPDTEDVYFKLPLPKRVRLGMPQFYANTLLRMMLGMPGFKLPLSSRLPDKGLLQNTDFMMAATVAQNILSLPSDTYTVSPF